MELDEIMDDEEKEKITLSLEEARRQIQNAIDEKPHVKRTVLNFLKEFKNLPASCSYWIGLARESTTSNDLEYTTRKFLAVIPIYYGEIIRAALVFTKFISSEDALLALMYIILMLEHINVDNLCKRLENDINNNKILVPDPNKIFQNELILKIYVQKNLYRGLHASPKDVPEGL